ncbi:LppX_LprAFG lipoprotein [Amycolatopsis suaedae]|uniref:LppX_LprAFG lipoprotein n=1 Tax=Amycolatopsis suaedae TaxID=2510978 RepID=A0A4Q7J5D2_9PSEU|nr:LppX_LprAFG lipoprotein [Amycolatopsis suaedae]RZQ62791.1 LppX_LprAFG lipoprotein [Amycolatopsis suaedae]
MKPRRLLFAAFALAIGATLGACSSDEPGAQLPDAATLVSESATAMRDVRSAHFTLQTNGTVAGLSVQSLEGDLTKDGGPSGSAKGTGKLELGGQLIEGEFVLTGDTLYLKGPTGGFQKIPAMLSSSVYDPSAVLDPERGIAKVIGGVQEPKTEAREDVGGVAAYKVTGKLPQAALTGLLPGVQGDTEATYWLQADGKRLPLKASVKFPDGATVEVTLSDVDKPVTVTPPA